MQFVCIQSLKFRRGFCTLVLFMTLFFLQVLWESSSEEEGEEEEEEREGASSVKSSSGVVDVEDVGDMLHRTRPSQSGRELKIRKRVEKREMVTPLLRKNLTKQGNPSLMFTLLR